MTGNVDGRDDGVENGGYAGLVPKKGASAGGLQDLLGGAAHVDVDHVGAGVGGVARGVCHQARIGAQELHDLETRFGLLRPASGALAALAQFRLARRHLAHGVARTELPTDLPEGEIRHARHRGEHHGIRDRMGVLAA